MADGPHNAIEQVNGQTAADHEPEIDLREYWRILVERRRVSLTCLGVTVVLTALFTFLAIPQYLATTTLQIERQGPEILTFQDVLGVDPAGYKDFYQTQYRIIQSRSVLKLAAERLDLVHNPEFLSRKGTPAGRLFRWAKSLILTPPEDDPQAVAVAFIQEGLSVQPVRNSQLVQISFLDRDPQLAGDVANAVADAYQQFSREARYSMTEEASDFLTKQVARVQAEISSLERQLQEYGSEKEIIALSDGLQDISEQALADLNARRSDARGRLAVADARYSAVQEASPDSFPEVLNSHLVNNLKQDYAELERRCTQMSERFKPGWPGLQELEEELHQAEERLDLETMAIVTKVREAARSDYEQALAEVSNLTAQVQQQKEEVKRVNRDAIEYAGLQSEIKTRRDVLSDLVTRQSQTEASEQLHDTTASNITVVDRAELPERPSKPRKALNLVMSLLMGSGLGVGIAFLLHYLDNTIKTEQDIERYAPGVAVLGNVPLLHDIRVAYGRQKPYRESEQDASKLNPDFASHLSPRSYYAESFKNLRTSLLLASPDHPPRRIAITSAEPGDGKSTVAINLAIVLTQMGRKVLLIDADLRRPRLYKALEVSNDVGLSSILSGNADIEDAIRQSEIPGLWATPSGPIPPNPSELFDSPALAKTLDRIEENGFDHVVFDCPPAIQVADSLILSTKMDATVLVVRSGSTTRDSLGQGTARLRQARAQLAGAVLNAIPERSRYYYYRRYRYYRRSRSESQEPTGGAGDQDAAGKRDRLRAGQG